MEVLGVVPSDAIKIHFGLFCAGNFQFGPEERQRLENIGNFQWADVYKVNLKEELMVHLRNQEIRHIPLDRLDFMRRHACQFCDDYAAEYADLSFGGLSAPEGWTTVIVRSQQGRAVLTQALGSSVEASKYRESPALSQALMSTVHEWSEKKKQAAGERFRELQRRAV